MTSLSPVYTIGNQIIEALDLHRDLSKKEARDEAINLLRRVGIAVPERRVDEYPHQLSGGMRQRVMIAMALARRPKLLIADEPTTALDVTVQAQILDLLRDLQQDTGMSIILITHDLGVVAEMADEVAVMYAGRVVERAPAGALFGDPMHPYTLGLLGSVPRLDEDRESLLAIDGSVPPPFALPTGCRFHPRCPFAAEACKAEPPPLRDIAPGHQAACLRAPVEAFAA
jgi:peptide/nickel transport system ATP-binding protein/oligopeptide transport system ATP-binding protein